MRERPSVARRRLAKATAPAAPAGPSKRPLVIGTLALMIVGYCIGKYGVMSSWHTLPRLDTLAAEYLPYKLNVPQVLALLFSFFTPQLIANIESIPILGAIVSWLQSIAAAPSVAAETLEGVNAIKAAVIPTPVSPPPDPAPVPGPAPAPVPPSPPSTT
jgi:hypothetical protein